MPQISDKYNSQSFLNSCTAEDIQIPVDELSGDQGVDKTVMVTFRPQSKASLFSTSITVIKSIIGSAIISLPYTVSVMGWFLSVIMFIFFAIGTQYTTYILLKVKNLSKHSTYNSIFYHIYRSKICQFALSFLNMFCNVGFCVAMLTVLKGALKKIINDFIQTEGQFYVEEWFIAIIVSILLLPAVLVKKIESLRYISIIGVFCLILAIFCMFIIFFEQMSDREWQNSFTMNAFPTDILAAISVFPNIMFALIYQMNFFSIFKGLKNSTDKRMNKASSIGVGFSIIIYILIGLMGYCLFGHDDKYVNASFLLELDKNQISPVLYIGIYVGFLICDLFCIPPTIFVARNNMIVMIKMFIQYNKNNNKKYKSQFKSDTIQQINSFIYEQSRQQSKHKAKIRFYIYTIILYFIYVLITILVTSLQAVFNIVGAIASCSLSFIMPFAFYVLLIKRKNKIKTINYYVCFLGVVVTLPLGILAIVSLYI